MIERLTKSRCVLFRVVDLLPVEDTGGERVVAATPRVIDCVSVVEERLIIIPHNLSQLFQVNTYNIL